MKKLSLLFLSAVLAMTSSCSGPNITDDLLDGNIIFDPSLYNPEEFLVSAKYPNPTPDDLDKHIILAISGYFNTHLHPKNIFLVDPIVVPTNKLQTIVGIVGPMIVYSEVDQTSEENKHWYKFRPYETINELNSVMKIVRKDLERGVTLPSGTYFKEFHSLHDPVASTTSSVLIHKGLKTSSGAKPDVQLMNSDIH